MKNILAALAKVKEEIGVMSKDTENPFFKSKYFDINQLIAHVDPLLAKNGLLLLQPLYGGEVCSEIHHVETGEVVKSWLKIPEMTDPQKTGSAVTYFRRYTLASLLGVQAEDDDANKASDAKKHAGHQSDTATELDLPWLNIFESDKSTHTRDWSRFIAKANSGEKIDLSAARKHFKISKAVEAEIKKLPNQ